MSILSRFVGMSFSTDFVPRFHFQSMALDLIFDQFHSGTTFSTSFALECHFPSLRARFDPGVIFVLFRPRSIFSTCFVKWRYFRPISLGDLISDFVPGRYFQIFSSGDDIFDLFHHMTSFSILFIMRYYFCMFFHGTSFSACSIPKIYFGPFRPVTSFSHVSFYPLDYEILFSACFVMEYHSHPFHEAILL